MGLSSILTSASGFSSGGIATSLLGSSFSGDLASITKDIKKYYSDAYKYNFEIKDVSLQTSTYSRIIPEIFGKMRVSGNVIWTSGVKKETTTTPQRSKSGTISTTTTTSYSTSIAIAICKGMASVESVYADDTILNMDELNLEIYTGSEDQVPNPTIQSHKGSTLTPAFRGLCYIVITNFSLNNYDGRIPNFSFDVTCKKSQENKNEAIKAVCVIPGSGEFVYDTEVQYKMTQKFLNGVPIGYEKGNSINQNNAASKSDGLLGFETMCKDLPNLEYISLVCSWFGDSIDIKNCKITPKVEYKNAKTSPDEYLVAGKIRDELGQVSLDSNGNIRFGGTPSDSSILKYVKNARKIGKKVCFYPMLMMDFEEKPWRGRLSGSCDDISDFFSKNQGYNEFILHYANLLKENIDSFIIGSEMIGITSIKNDNNDFLGVKEFVNLAKKVRSILGNSVKITYAADWSEYHHTNGGFFNMDELWACENIDFIGIDAYFPLTNSKNSTYETNEIKNGWQSGEGWDFYYEDKEKIIKKSLSSDFAWKNVGYFWENYHTNPDGKKTKWQPKMKKIWFTEFGFPSVDCPTNQPNVFYSPSSQDSGFPHLSSGEVDFKAQKNAIFASLEYFQSCEFLENAFLWTYDARPYPYFPNKSSVWSDSKTWKYGHFVNGKLTKNSISEIIEYLCLKSGFSDEEFEIIGLDFDISGLIINSKTNCFEMIKMLAEIYEFEVILASDKIIFQHQNTEIIETILNENCVTLDGKTTKNNTIKSKNELVNSIELLFINSSDYRTNTAIARNNGDRKYSLKLPISMTKNEASAISGKILYNLSSKSNEYEIKLPISYGFLSPSDIISIELENNEMMEVKIQVISFNFSQNFITINAKNFNTNLTQISSKTIITDQDKESIKTGNTNIFLYQIPHHLNKDFVENKINISCAIDGDFSGWSGVNLYLKNSENDYEFLLNSTTQSTTGVVVLSSQGGNISSNFIDTKSIITILLNDDLTLSDLSKNHQYNENFAILGGEIIRYKKAKFIDEKVYEISEIQRGCFQTSIEANPLGKSFSLISDMKTFQIDTSLFNSEISIVAKTNYQLLKNATITKFTPEKKYQESLKNFKIFLDNADNCLVKICPKFTKTIDFWNGVSDFSKTSLNVLNQKNETIYFNDEIIQNTAKITKNDLKNNVFLSEKYVKILQHGNIIY